MEGIIELLIFVVLGALVLIPLLRATPHPRETTRVSRRAGSSVWIPEEELPAEEPHEPEPAAEILPPPEPPAAPPAMPPPHPPPREPPRMGRPTREELRRAVVWTAVLGEPAGAAGPVRPRRGQPRRAR